MSCSDSEDDIFVRAPRNPVDAQSLRMRNRGRQSILQSVSSLAPANFDPDGRHQLQPRRRRMSHSDSPTPLRRCARRPLNDHDTYAPHASMDRVLFTDDNDSSICGPRDLFSGSRTRNDHRESSLFNPFVTSPPSIFLKRGVSASNLVHQFACSDVKPMLCVSNTVKHTSHPRHPFSGQFSSTWSATSASFKRFPGSMPLTISEDGIFEDPKMTRQGIPIAPDRRFRASVTSVEWERSKAQGQAPHGAPAPSSVSTLPTTASSTEHSQGELLLHDNVDKPAPSQLRKHPSSSRIPRLASLQQLRPTPAVIESAVALAMEGDAAFVRGGRNSNVALGNAVPTPSSRYSTRRPRLVSLPPVIPRWPGERLPIMDENPTHLIAASTTRGTRSSHIIASRSRVLLRAISVDESSTTSSTVQRFGKDPRLSASISSLPSYSRSNEQPHATAYPISTGVPHPDDSVFDTSDAEC